MNMLDLPTQPDSLGTVGVIAIVGTPAAGYRFIGPFSSRTDALHWCELHELAHAYFMSLTAPFDTNETPPEWAHIGFKIQTSWTPKTKNKKTPEASPTA